MSILNEAKSDVPVLELCRMHHVSSVEFYQWRRKYGGSDVTLISEIKHFMYY